MRSSDSPRCQGKVAVTVLPVMVKVASSWVSFSPTKFTVDWASRVSSSMVVPSGNSMVREVSKSSMVAWASQVMRVALPPRMVLPESVLGRAVHFSVVRACACPGRANRAKALMRSAIARSRTARRSRVEVLGDVAKVVGMATPYYTRAPCPGPVPRAGFPKHHTTLRISMQKARVSVVSQIAPPLTQAYYRYAPWSKQGARWGATGSRSVKRFRWPSGYRNYRPHFARSSARVPSALSSAIALLMSALSLVSSLLMAMAYSSPVAMVLTTTASL